MNTASRFGQGNDVDRARPHVFHRDYWTLRAIREELERSLSDHAAVVRGRRVLDLGAGVSPYADLVRAAGAKELVSADIGPVAQGVLEIGPDGRVPVEDGTFDAVLSTQVLEHVADVQGYLREACRVLRPGGVMFCSTHGAFVLHRHPTDFRRWTVDGLKLEMEAAGFVVEGVRCRLGILAMSTHLRAIALGGLTRRVPGTGWLRPVIYLLANLRMGLEDAVTPASVMEAHPELIVAAGRKPTADAGGRGAVG